jgi:hypothetical protein
MTDAPTVSYPSVSDGLGEGAPSSRDAPRLSRLAVRIVHCSECGAEPGEPRRGHRGRRKANHQTRVEYALIRLGLA